MSEHVQELTKDEVRDRIAALAREHGMTVDEARERLESGELDHLVVSAQLRALLWLLG